MRRISEFRGKYDFLSNFFPCSVKVEGKKYPSSEHAFQALKSLDPEIRNKIRNAETPGEAKALGRRTPLRPMWDNVKNEVMYQVVYAKFSQNIRLKRMLLETGDAILIEGNWWGDRYWGVSQGEGENHLGKILMRVRKELSTGKRQKD